MNFKLQLVLLFNFTLSFSLENRYSISFNESQVFRSANVDLISESEESGSNESDEDTDYNENSLEHIESDEFSFPKGFKRIGDMLIPTVSFYSAIFTRRWTRNKSGLVFVYSSRFSAKEIYILESAISDIDAPSCIPIKLMNETEFRKDGRGIKNYVFISRNVRQGCYSNVGMLGGRQRLNLDPFGCINKGNALHEMIHSLGYEHEQSRPDRDQYVSINYKNVRRGYEPNFWISRRSKLVGPYDFSSIMHYRSDAFAKNLRIPTILSKVTGKKVPTKNGSKLTDLDIFKIKAITGCQENENGGMNTTTVKTNATEGTK